jgi:molecular chaperone GrpE
MNTHNSPMETEKAADEPVSALQQERDDLYERLLRTTAEFDNYRKRTERERRSLSEAVSADLIQDLLPVIDDLERALRATETGGDPAVDRLRQGFELIHRQLLDVLRRRGVEPLDVVGRDFDPEWHESVATEPATGARDGEITAEIRRGYRIGQRLLRPAMVRVATA